MKLPFGSKKEVPEAITSLPGYNPASNGVRLLPGQKIVINGKAIENAGDGIVYWGEYR